MRLWPLILLVPLAGCDTSKLFGEYDVPEAPGTAEAPWPRLVDTPAPPPAGTYTAAVPDPAQGIAATAQLGIVSREAGLRAVAVAPPPVDEDALRPRAAAAQSRAQRLSAIRPITDAGLEARVAAARARAQALSAPVLTEAERQRLLAATRR